MECWKKKVDWNCSMKVGDYSLNFQNYLNLLVSDMRKERGGGEGREERRGEKGQRTTDNGRGTRGTRRGKKRGIGERYRVERGDERGERGD